MTQTVSSRKLSNQRDKPPDQVSIKVQSDEFYQTIQKETQTVEQGVASLQVVHVTAERIRIRATESSTELLHTIVEELRKLKGIKQVTWNEETQNLVIAFDKEVLAQSQLLEILDKYGVRRLSEPDNKNKVDPFAAWKSVEFWKEQGIDLIPLLTGLAITSRLGVTGLASIPICMLTSDVTRRTINSFREALKAEPENKSEAKTANRTSQPLVSKVDKTSTIERSLDDVVTNANVDYSIVHSIPGRIRFNVPQIGKDKAYARRLEKMLNNEFYATNVRLKTDAASIAISYQPASLDVSHWVNLIQLASVASNVVSTTQPVEQQTEKKIDNKNIVLSRPQAVEAEAVIKSINKSNIGISQLTTSEATNGATSNGVSSLIADLKPPFINVLIDVVAHFPIN
ncbi:unknown protein [Rivularia sp. IAM M-261]|nr:unknown protein [Calothrix sp. PCC 7716]GJD23341.1 unknown protein [Rivularia sp. IAM M-261]